jgi:hypothetical protein
LRLDAEMRALNGRFDSLQRTLLQVGGVMTAVLVGVIGTQPCAHRNVLSANVSAMEAAVAEWEVGMTEGNERPLDELGKRVGYLSGRVDEMSKRIDGLSERVDQGFTQVDARFAQMDARFAQVDGRFAQIDARFDALHRTLLQLGGGMFAALLGLIATQI